MIKYLLIFTGVCFFLISSNPPDFKNEQLRYPRVRNAFREKSPDVEKLFNCHAIKKENLEIYLRAFKYEKKLELWAKSKGKGNFILLKKYEICKTSGALGPKRKQGDFQIPEGFYHIDRFNPYSNFHLSLGINYPNKSDRILGDKNPGGNIFIHGACATIGCIPITDEEIKELYIICVEAFNNGQENIPVTIFPAVPQGEIFDELKAEFSKNPEITGLWVDLKKSYDLFNRKQILPTIRFLENGRHEIR